MIPAYGATALPVFAGGSCTGWNSTTVPPDYIRVGRSDGTVDVVKFRKYVGVVAAREWPYYLPGAARRVGAIAVKQYGWYFTLAGHHRDGYVNARGKCYDVKDGTRDQLYKPEKTTVHRETWRAVDRTWTISLRRNGNFFMTGYRYGSDVRCGADADGRLLYERSVRDCAKRGKSVYTILNKYISGLTVMDGKTVTTALASLAAPPALTPEKTTKRTTTSKTEARPAASTNVFGTSVVPTSLFPAPSVAAELLPAPLWTYPSVVSAPVVTPAIAVDAVALYVTPKVRGPAVA